MKIKESGQDYLEAILILSHKQEIVRAIDICSYFGYARATVSVSLKHLKEEGFVDIGEHNHVFLTPKGKKEAEEVYERHQFLTRFFEDIGVSHEVAAKDACRVEHYVSKETFDALKEHFNSN